MVSYSSVSNPFSSTLTAQFRRVLNGKARSWNIVSRSFGKLCNWSANRNLIIGLSPSGTDNRSTKARPIRMNNSKQQRAIYIAFKLKRHLVSGRMQSHGWYLQRPISNAHFQYRHAAYVPKFASFAPPAPGYNQWPVTLRIPFHAVKVPYAIAIFLRLLVR